MTLAEKEEERRKEKEEESSEEKDEKKEEKKKNSTEIEIPVRVWKDAKDHSLLSLQRFRRTHHELSKAKELNDGEHKPLQPHDGHNHVALSFKNLIFKMLGTSPPSSTGELFEKGVRN